MNDVANQAGNARGMGSGMMGAAAGRQHAKNVLLDAARRYRKQAERFEKLAQEIDGLSTDAESALWELAIKA